MKKNEKKIQSKFHCNQMHVSWFKFGGTNIERPVHGSEVFEFKEISKKNTYGEDQEDAQKVSS